MGIKNLKKLIQKNAKTAIKPKPDLQGKRVAIDSSILLYKSRYLHNGDNFHIVGFLSTVIGYLEENITPVFVFDGPAPQAKKNVLDKRCESRISMIKRVNDLKTTLIEMENIDDIDTFIEEENVTENCEKVKEIQKLNTQIHNIEKNILIVKKIHSDQTMEFLETLGIPFLRAYSEAEETCSFLQKNGHVDYVITEDTDSLAFGANEVIFGNDVYNLETILDCLEITYDEFIDLCILCGCDYTCTIPKIGPVSALSLIKKHRSIENIIELNKKYTIPSDFDYQQARNLFKQNETYNIVQNFDLQNMDIKKVKQQLNTWGIHNCDYFINKLNFLRNNIKESSYEFLGDDGS